MNHPEKDDDLDWLCDAASEARDRRLARGRRKRKTLIALGAVVAPYPIAWFVAAAHGYSWGTPDFGNYMIRASSLAFVVAALAVAVMLVEDK